MFRELKEAVSSSTNDISTDVTLFEWRNALVKVFTFRMDDLNLIMECLD